MPSYRNLRDASLSVSSALPNGATTTQPATGLDTGPRSQFGSYAPSIDGELLLEAPALTTTQLPDTKTVVYDFITSDNADLSSAVVVKQAAITQLGAGGAGAAAATSFFRPTSAAKRYFGFVATGVSGTNASTASATLSYVF